jgi:hypothetical protein
LRRCPHLLNLAAKLEENSKNLKGKRLDLPTSYLPNKLEEEGRPYHFPSYTSSSNKQANKEEKCTSKLEKEGKSKR